MQSASSRFESKSPSASLAEHLIQDVGLNPAQARITLEHVNKFIGQYYNAHRAPGVLVYTAVSASEPAGKPIKHCKKVPVPLTYLHDHDAVLTGESTVEMRKTRIYRLCCEAYAQGGLLSQEDLAYLLCIDRSTVRDLIAKLRADGILVPTRGAIKDIGPEPSHKRIIADLLGRGYSTTKVGAMTSHSEGSIGNYQLDFAFVLYLLAKYPDATEDQHIQLSDLPPKTFQVYAEVARALGERPDCRPHLDRIRRFYDMDPKGLTRRLPPGKAPKDRATARLDEQTVATAVRQTIQEDLALTSSVAGFVAGNVMDVVMDSYVVTEQLRPGETIVFVDAHDADYMSGEKVSDRRVIPVRLPLYTEQACEIWRSDEPVGRRRAVLASLYASAAYEQGGVMTLSGLAELLHTGPSSLGKSLRELAVEVHCEIPTKGSVEDMGPTLTHKDWIVDLDHHGLTGDQISWLTRHAPLSRDRYIRTFRRAEILMRLEGGIPSTEVIARLLRLRRNVAQQYVDLLRKYYADPPPTDGDAPTVATGGGVAPPPDQAETTPAAEMAS